MSAIPPERIKAERVLVIAPHPDDESLGCGGLMASLARTGTRFFTVFVTDGGASHPGSPSWPRARLAARRETEAEAALVALGVGDHPRALLRLADAAMPEPSSEAWRRSVASLAAILASFEPDLVVLPWRRDPHGDHRACWSLAREALATMAAIPRTLEYAVWLDELGTPDDRPRLNEAVRVDIDVSAVQMRKRDAVLAHISQTTDLIDDDPNGFRLSPATIERLTGPVETYWHPLP